MKRSITLRGFAQMSGLALALIGLCGMLGLGGVLGLGELLGLRHLIAPREEVRLADNGLYLLTGVLFSFAGFGRMKQELRRDVVGIMSVLYLLSAAICVGGQLFFELPLDLYSLGYGFERATLGVLFVLVAKFPSPRE